MSLAPQAEECQQTVDDEIALDSTFLLRKVVRKARSFSFTIGAHVLVRILQSACPGGERSASR